MWQSDEELMLAFANGDELAFESLYYRYEKPILNFINRMLMNQTEALGSIGDKKKSRR